jgi:hypothetical protein
VRILPYVNKDTVYEVRCEQCQTSFAPETRRCVHCGARLARGRRVVSTEKGFDPDNPPIDQAPGEYPPEEGEVLSRGPRTAIWVVMALLTAVASMLRTCVD